MKNLKNIIIILFLILLIALIVICILINKLKDNQKTQQDLEYTDISADFIKQLGVVEDYSTFFSVEEMLKKFVGKIEAENSKVVYNLIDSSYVKEKNITQENVLEYMVDIALYASKVRIIEIYENKNENNSIYYIDCILEKENKGKEFYFSICVDERNLAYAVTQLDETTYKNIINEEELKIEEKVIERNTYNKSLFINPTDEEIVTKYFEDFLNNALYYPEYAYNLLDETYRNKCFPKLQDFKDYIETKREIFESNDLSNLKTSEDFETIEEYRQYMYQVERLKIEKYQIRKVEGKRRYICIDTEGNYYTFYAESPLNYTVILDNYTIPTEDFVNTYNSSSDEKKAILNIERFFMGINDKNYGYSYSVLSSSFKSNKYPTKEEFIKYVQENFFEENKIEQAEYNEENGLYVYEIKIKDATGKSSEEKTYSIVVKLNNGTDFEMSFGEN